MRLRYKILMNKAMAIVTGTLLLLFCLSIRFIPFLLLAWIIVHFIKKWW